MDFGAWGLALCFLTPRPRPFLNSCIRTFERGLEGDGRALCQLRDGLPRANTACTHQIRMQCSTWGILLYVCLSARQQPPPFPPVAAPAVQRAGRPHGNVM